MKNIKGLKKAELVELVLELQKENERLKNGIANLFELANGVKE